jgi:hypothetical protein
MAVAHDNPEQPSLEFTQNLKEGMAEKDIE